MTLYREEGSDEYKCICNSQILPLALWEGGGQLILSQRFILREDGGGGGLDKIWILGGGGGGKPTWGHLQLLRGGGGGLEKKGSNLGGRCATVYAHGDFLFKVLLIAVDGL